MGEEWDWQNVEKRIEQAKQAIVALGSLTDPAGTPAVAEKAINGALLTLGWVIAVCYRLKVRLPGLAAMPGLDGGVWLTWGEGTPPENWLVMHRIPAQGRRVIRTRKVGSGDTHSEEMEFEQAMDEFEEFLRTRRDKALKDAVALKDAAGSG